MFCKEISDHQQRYPALSKYVEMRILKKSFRRHFIVTVSKVNNNHLVLETYTYGT